METSNFMEKGNIPNEANNSGCNWMKFRSLAALVLLALVVVPVLVVCFLCLHRQSPETCWAHASHPTRNPAVQENPIIWQWNFRNCNSFVRNGSDQTLEVLHDGIYFVYAQVTREKSTKSYFTMMLYKDQNILLNQVTGPQKETIASINFGRPYFLKKGEKLFCSINDGLNHIQKDNQTYWGLYKM